MLTDIFSDLFVSFERFSEGHIGVVGIKLLSTFDLNFPKRANLEWYCMGLV